MFCNSPVLYDWCRDGVLITLVIQGCARRNGRKFANYDSIMI